MSRPAWAAAAAVLVAVVVAFAESRVLARSARPHDWVTVTVTAADGRPPAARVVSPGRGRWDRWTLVADPLDRWVSFDVWVTDAWLVAPRAGGGAVSQVEVRFGDRTVTLTPADLPDEPPPPGLADPAFERAVPLTAALPPAPGSALPGYADVRNWPGDRVVVGRMAGRVAGMAGVAAAAALWVLVARRTRAPAVAGWWLTPAPLAARPPGHWGWELVGVAALAGGVAALEARQPYYFSRDDAAVAELNVFVYTARGLWDGGLAEYNPLLFLGTAHASSGVVQAGYPPLYVAYAVARHLLGDEQLTLEVAAVLHLAAGYVLARAAARRVGMGRLPAVLAAAAFVLSGPVLVIGRSWHGFIANAVWPPALALALAALATGPVGWRWVLGTGLAVGLYVHTGFTQNPAFGCGFLVLGAAYLVAVGGVPVRRAMLVGPAVLVGVGLGAPLLHQQAERMADVQRGYAGGAALTDVIPSMFLPYPVTRDRNVGGYIQADAHRGGQVAFFGGLLAWLAAAEAVALAVAGAAPGGWGGRVWLALAGAALLLGLGDDGPLWPAGGGLPVVESLFRLPFRMLPFAALFGCLAGGLVLDRLLRRAASARAEVAAGGVGFGLVAYGLWLATPAFFDYPVPPYPPLPSALAPVAADGAAWRHRCLPVGPRQSRAPVYPYTLMMDTNMAYGVPTLDGYNPIAENATYLRAYRRLASDPPVAARAYGVRWVVVGPPPTPGLNGFGRGVPNAVVLARLEPHLTPVAEVGGVRLLEVPDPAPLAFAAARPADPLPVSAGPFGVDVGVSGLAAGADVTVNFLMYPRLRAYLDGRPVPAEADDWGRVKVRLDGPADRLTVRLEPTWRTGLLAGGGLLLAGLAAAAVLLRRQPREAVGPDGG